MHSSAATFCDRCSTCVGNAPTPAYKTNYQMIDEAPSPAMNPPATAAKLLKLLNDVHDQAVAAAGKLRISASPANHCAVLLYFTLVESAGSVAILRENSRFAGVTAIVRSALDAFVDIKNLLSEPEYWRHLDAADSIEWKKVLEAASVPGNDYLVGLSGSPRFPANRQKVAAKVAAYAKAGIAKLSPEERFEKAKLTAEYQALYSMLSADSHNNTSALKTRHTRQEGDETLLELYSGKGSYADSVLLSLAEMIMFTTEDLHERFGEGKETVAGIRAMVHPVRLAAADMQKATAGVADS